MRKRYFTLLTVIFLFLVSTCGCSRKDGQQEESLPPAQAPEVTLPDVSPVPPEFTAQAANGKTLEECVSSINDSFRLGSEVIAQLVTDDLTAREKAEVLYAYIAENVAYDFRYYNDRMNMPFESTVAIGALRDNLAICGGYAQAFQTLLDMCGIENYTVSGVSHGENHMWNYVVLDGVGYFCDPTADRGGMSRHFLLTVDELKSSGGYSWDHDFLLRISGAADAPA